MEETATDQVEGVTAETMSIVESEGEVAIIDETVSEAIDEYGNDVVVDETITDIIRATAARPSSTRRSRPPSMKQATRL